MTSWESYATDRAQDHIRRMLTIAAEQVRQALEAREGTPPFAMALGKDGELTSTVAHREDVGSLLGLLASQAPNLWAGIILVDPGEEAGISVMVFEGDHREAPPFRAVIPWARAENGKVKLYRMDIIPTNWQLFD